MPSVDPEIAAGSLERLQRQVGPTSTAAPTETHRWRLRYREAGWGEGRDGGGRFLCDAFSPWGHNQYDPAYFGRGTRLTVLEDGIEITPPTVRILPPSCENKKTGDRTLVCMASGFYPDHVNMTWESNKIGNVSTDAAATREDKYYKITSRLTVSNKDWIEAKTKFKCIVNFFDGTKHINKTDVFTIKPPLIPGMTRGKYVKITQNAKLSYTVLIVKSCLYAALVCFLVWKLKGKREKPTK